MNKNIEIIESAFSDIENITSSNVGSDVKKAIDDTLNDLDEGKIRVCEKKGADWITNQWIKKAILLSFRTYENYTLGGPYATWFDKVPGKTAGWDKEKFLQAGFRYVPNGAIRKSAYIAKNAVVMPSFINVGAYVGEGTMVDTWATVGSCAQIGKNVHLSGGVGIGGVLEPLQASPTIIEDNCFIGARSEIVEGVIVEKGSVISMGVYIGQSTRIYDRETGKIQYGRVPAGSVVVSGNLPSKDGSYSLYAAIIVKKVDEKTLSKVGINNILREAE
ncbi:MAG: 2,3,4,5-tetrahydropyridine-2,6-dicarboxylate N-succinyltransferase [Pseudomonadota bacterium]|nr:2,3,4,5-tetrahydropyridine-2,6-dicarboxylate N-succinyltransferase [Pseudomonadota bacterium]|tara:strand:+ start:1838 stop:2662 length:825 start_codon:yes stop_codon:yes gene_type:complete